MPFKINIKTRNLTLFFSLLIFFIYLKYLPGILVYSCPINQKTKGWQSQNRVPTQNHIFKVKFINNKIGWACCSKGVIIKTINGGKDWERIESGELADINDISFFDSQNLIAITNRGQILKSNDGGNKWHVINELQGYNFYNSVVIDKESMLISGYSLSKNESIILSTDDRGESWHKKFESKHFSFRKIILKDEKTLLSIDSENGSLVLLSSNDWGQNWSKQKFDISIYPTSIFFLNQKEGWVVGENKIMTTIDGGRSWKLIRTDNKMHYINDVFFVSPEVGYCIGSDRLNFTPLILKTIDKGITWKQVEIETIFGVTLNSICFTENQIGLAVGTGGAIFYTDNHRNWGEISKGYLGSLYDIHFLDEDNGFVIGGKSPNNSCILTTKNSGISWEKLELNSSPPMCFSFVNQNLGWIACKKGEIFKTINGGKNWTGYSHIDNDIPVDISFINENQGWILGEKSVFYTKDGGKNWNHISNIDLNYDLPKIHFFDDSHGWYGGIFETVDGGNTWKKIELPGNISRVTNYYFRNRKNGWIVAEGYENEGLIYFTEDTGKTWKNMTPEKTGASFPIYDIFFINKETGWFVTTNGCIYKTNNGGSNWILQESGTTNPLLKIFFINQETGWIVGSWGTILKTQTSGN